MVPSSLVRPGRKERTELTLEKLQEGYQKVVNLVESIQKHLGNQEQRTQQLVDAMNQMAGDMADLPQETVKQTAALKAVATMMEENAASDRQRDDHLARLPELVESQSQTGARVARTLDGLNESVSALGDATHSSTSALQKLHNDAAERDERLAVLFAEQTKRFTIVFSFAITLAVVAAVIGVVALLR